VIYPIVPNQRLEKLSNLGRACASRGDPLCFRYTAERIVIGEFCPAMLSLQGSRQFGGDPSESQIDFEP
jgi:hypothetical protein